MLTFERGSNVGRDTERTCSYVLHIHSGMAFGFPENKNEQFQKLKKVWTLQIQKYLFSSISNIIYLSYVDYVLYLYCFSFYHLECSLNKYF